MKIRNIFPLALILLTVLGCDDITETDDVRNAHNLQNVNAPNITKIVMASDTSETAIDSAAFNQVVRIEGDNLANVKSLRFNNINVDLKEIFSTYDAVLVKIPRQLPDTVTNMVYLQTDKGSTTAPFKVTVPALNIDGLYCEYAQPGDTTYIQGNDFDLYGITAEDAIIKVGDKDVNVLAASNDELMIQIPSNAKMGDTFSIQGSKMTSPIYLSYAGPLDDAKSGVSKIFDFNNWPGTGAFTHASKYSWAPKNFLYDKFIAGDDDPKPLGDDGKYIRFKDTVKAWGWMVFWAGYIDLPEDVAKNPQNYQMRFEFWNDSKYPLNSTYRIIFGNYQWYPGGSGVALNTNNNWKTIRINLDDTDPEGHVLVPAGTDSSVRYPFMIIFSPTSSDVYNLAMTNFRFVKK